ncbi:BirA, biotin-(Acetyl-CoA-carboxylase) ligase [Hyella patelloides LEGE 07179]|uniref:BirA, biotin-(Acetyl-CoA-carboxylase) ligase n=1 Tax=Hyella patelloides LEGE 07179 TaxID=945734 RepID=A0A563VTQ1_9CYAN|nr:biotin--[acetyl-CoA-carboxylase] ligase [Hyella patelloides]VEP14785.1 BirA, biotin-(Acetyl-CoA-carboxylase) ligase [Hyella patelloides LEGE 07179]
MLNDKYQHEINCLEKRYSVELIKFQMFNCLDSTNKKMWQLIDNNSELPIAIIAVQQTSGKGQWGKTWQSGLGGLYLSVALKCDLILEHSFHLVMAIAVGITDILRDRQLPVTIKWSNDLILNKRKLGGIKIETRTKNNLIKYAVVGVGINWQNSVPEIGINLASYYQNQIQIPRGQQINSLEQLTAITTVGILKGYQDYQQLGISYTLQKYQQLLNSIGKQITINNYLGIITGVTPQGQLKVRLKSPGATTEIFLDPGKFSLGYDL